MTTRSSALLLCVTALATPTTQATANYRPEATTYSVPPSITYDGKRVYCRKSFGKHATLLDMKTAKDDFSSAEEFDKALSPVYLGNPTAAFYVAYGGTDIPPNASSENNKYAIRDTSDGQVTIDSFGKARVESYPQQAQLLCAVPTKNAGTSAKRYVSKEEEEEDFNKRSAIGLSITRVSCLMFFVGLAFLVRHLFRSFLLVYGGMPSKTMRSPEAYYSVLDSEAHRANADATAPIMEGCELSYNPVSQGLV